MSTNWNWKNWTTSQEDAEWGEARKTVITASVVPEFFGLGYRAWKDLSCNFQDSKADSNPLVQRGKECEPIAVEDFLEGYKKHFRNETLFVCQPGLLIREQTIENDVISLGASLDRLLLRIPGGCVGKWKTQQWINLEVKVPNKFHGLPSVSEIKPRYLLQVVIQMWVAKLSCSFLFFWREDSNVCFRVDWNESAQAVMDFVLGLVPEMEAYYIENKQKPRINPFKVFANDLSKLIDKLEVTQVWNEFTNSRSLHEMQNEGSNYDH